MLNLVVKKPGLYLNKNFDEKKGSKITLDNQRDCSEPLYQRKLKAIFGKFIFFSNKNSRYNNRSYLINKLYKIKLIFFSFKKLYDLFLISNMIDD